MRKLLRFLPVFLLVSTVAAEIRLFNPTDKFLTFNETLMAQGKADPGEPLLFNGVPFTAAEDGTFACGLVLRGGKNLVTVAGRKESKSVRVLRLVTYPDIEESYEGKKHWARGQIVYTSTLGYVEGYPDGNFYPANPATRGEFATWLAKVKKLTIPSLESDVFFDVPKEHWRAPFVKAVTDRGYMVPFSREIFGIDEPISRREAAEIAVKAEGLGIIARITPLFRDVPQEETGAAPIYTARERGLVIGVSPDLPVYDPERAITRAEAATLISRFYASQLGVRALSDFESGYGPDRLCRLNVAPQIAAFTIEPATVPAGKLSTIRLRAAIASRESFVPIARVKIDLTAVGGMPDAEMFDDATAGDETAGDLIYSLNISYEPTTTGDKALRVTAADRLGWEGKSEEYLTVTE
ncbi:MAG: S-layer homology domain-containing protein [Candidatus Margulisiibacteriota bacterium]